MDAPFSSGSAVWLRLRNAAEQPADSSERSPEARRREKWRQLAEMAGRLAARVDDEEAPRVADRQAECARWIDRLDAQRRSLQTEWWALEADWTFGEAIHERDVAEPSPDRRAERKRRQAAEILAQIHDRTAEKTAELHALLAAHHEVERRVAEVARIERRIQRRFEELADGRSPSTSN
ncbi:hypothetical protein M3Y99_00108700 [Aphelenchoides fujianensis]|nr:hypothetical protein M3Y99_00108700 [Aphelenchoides fujianensis]